MAMGTDVITTLSKSEAEDTLKPNRVQIDHRMLNNFLCVASLTILDQAAHVTLVLSVRAGHF